MTDDGTGLINNVFEIENTFNEYAISDIDSVEGNHADGEDDMSSADVIIGIKNRWKHDKCNDNNWHSDNVNSSIVYS